MYSEDDSNRFLEVTYASGDKEVLFFKDFASGAMIQNVVDRAKKHAIKDLLSTGARGLRVDHLLRRALRSSRRTRTSPTPRTRDDWARISGKSGERIVFVRTIVQDAKQGERVEPHDRHRRLDGPVPVATRLGWRRDCAACDGHRDRVRRRDAGQPEGERDAHVVAGRQCLPGAVGAAGRPGGTTATRTRLGRAATASTVLRRTRPCSRTIRRGRRRAARRTRTRTRVTRPCSRSSRSSVRSSRSTTT